MRRPARLLLLLACCAGAALGCRQTDEIRTYEVAKEDQALPAVQPEAVPTRMLAAMLNGDRQAWFFKLMAPEQQVEPVADEVVAFLRDVHFDAEQLRPQWTLPEGWAAAEGSGMRLATLMIPAGDSKLEMSVIGLGLSGEWDAQVLDNVNRWRGQLGLKPLQPDSLAEAPSDELQTLEVDGRQLVIVDLHGEAAPAAGMTPPMAGGMTPPFASSAPQTAPPAAAPDNIDYQLPDGWREAEPTSMRLVNLLAGDPAAEAQVTVFRFSAAAPAMADPLANVNRWRRELQMPPTTQEELDEELEELNVSGGPAQLIKLAPAEGAESTLAVMTQRGGMVWFFKLRGPPETVAQQEDAFRSWLASVKLP